MVWGFLAFTDVQDIHIIVNDVTCCIDNLWLTGGLWRAITNPGSWVFICINTMTHVILSSVFLLTDDSHQMMPTLRRTSTPTMRQKLCPDRLNSVNLSLVTCDYSVVRIEKWFPNYGSRTKDKSRPKLVRDPKFGREAVFHGSRHHLWKCSKKFTFP